MDSNFILEIKEFSNIYYEDIVNKIKGDLELELIKKINEQLQDLGVKILKEYLKFKYLKFISLFLLGGCFI